MKWDEEAHDSKDLILDLASMRYSSYLLLINCYPSSKNLVVFSQTLVLRNCGLKSLSMLQTRLPTLRAIDLSHNSIASLPEEFSFPALETCDLRANQVTNAKNDCACASISFECNRNFDFRSFKCLFHTSGKHRYAK